MTNYTIQFDPTIFATFNDRNIPFSTESYTITPMREMLARMMGVEIDESPSNDNDLIIVSNENNLFGAACVYNPEVIARLTEICGGDFYIVPSSIHEVLAISTKPINDPADLLKINGDVNKMNGCISESEILGTFILKYDSTAHTLFKVCG